MVVLLLLLLTAVSQLNAYTYPSPELLKEQYCNKQVLVTGGYGFIGSHLVEQLLSLGAHVRVIDHHKSNNLDIATRSAVTIFHGSITDSQLCVQATENVDIIFHLAAFVSVPLSMEQPRACYETNVAGTFNLLEAARINKVSTLVLSSTSAAYGARDCACSEEMACAPTSPYGFSKLIDELLCQQYSTCFGLKTICLRYFNVFGERQNPHAPYAAVFARFKHQMKNNLPITIFGDGLQTRDFISVHDVVLCNLSLALLPENQLNGQVVNIGSGNSITVKRVFELVNQQYPEYTQEPTYAPARSGDVKDTACVCSKLCSLLALCA